MAYTAIVGASGYSGQETLDRVLAHPELDLFALGSDSLAGQPAGALDPRLSRNGASRAPAFVPNEEALRSGADLVFVCLDHERAAELDPPSPRRRRRSLRWAPAEGRRRLYRLVRLRPPARRRARELVLRHPGAAAADRAPRIQPRLLRDGRPARAPAAAQCRRPGGRRRRREVRGLGRRHGPEAELPCQRRARERLGVQGRCTPARARDRAGARLSGLLRPPPAAAPPRAHRHVLRARRSARPRRASCSRLRTRPRRRSRYCPRT